MSKVMTVRIDEALLAQLEKAAQSDERSLSAYVERILRQHVSAQPLPARVKKGVMGSLRHLGSPTTLEDFQVAAPAASPS